MSAYIYEGEDFTEVRASAYAFAKGLNCETADACGECLSCRTFDSSNHPDTFFIRGTKQSGIGVDEVREQIIMPMAVKPFKYKYKVFITEDALTPQAQNALLKTIEEPAPYGVFLFLGKSGEFLPTVLSRCIVKKIGNNISGAYSEYEDLAREIADEALGADIPKAFALYRRLEPVFKDNKDALTGFLDALYVIQGKRRNFAAAEAVINTKKILAQNGNLQLAIELMLLRMR